MQRIKTPVALTARVEWVQETKSHSQNQKKNILPVVKIFIWKGKKNALGALGSVCFAV